MIRSKSHGVCIGCNRLRKLCRVSVESICPGCYRVKIMQSRARDHIPAIYHSEEVSFVADSEVGFQDEGESETQEDCCSSIGDFGFVVGVRDKGECEAQENFLSPIADSEFAAQDDKAEAREHVHQHLDLDDEDPLVTENDRGTRVQTDPRFEYGIMQEHPFDSEGNINEVPYGFNLEGDMNDFLYGFVSPSTCDKQNGYTKENDSESCCSDTSSEKELLHNTSLVFEGERKRNLDSSSIPESLFDGTHNVPSEIDENLTQTSDFGPNHTQNTGNLYYGGCNSCGNCRRESLKESEYTHAYPELVVILTKFSIEDINFKQRKWRLFNKNTYCGYITLCLLCQNFLLKKEIGAQDRTSWRNVWPSYFWKMLSCLPTKNAVGIEILNMIPSSWVPFWIYNLHHLVGYSSNQLAPFMLATQNNDCMPPLKVDPVCIDVTDSKRDFVGITNRLLLGELKNGCDKYLIPRILCPWGCTAYLHRCGFIAMDSIYAKFLACCKFVGSNCSYDEQLKVKSCRGDFFDYPVDCHLHNPLWSVHPSVYFRANEGPVFLTCPDHHGGTKEAYFHVPRHGTSLVSAFSDTLSHVVLRSRTIKTSQAHHYSNSYQLQKCTASYSGIDTCYVSDYRSFDFTSHFTDINESRSYAGRADIRSLTDRLFKTGAICGDMVESLKTRSKDLFLCNGNARSVGGTMMTLTDAMKLQKMLHEPAVISILCNGENGKHFSRDLKRLWPPYRMFVHPNDGYGFDFSNVGIMGKASDATELCWVICNLVVNIPILWELIDGQLASTCQWHGYILSFLSKHVLNYKFRVSNRYEKHPFALTSDKKGPIPVVNQMIKKYIRGSGCADAVFLPKHILHVFDIGIREMSIFCAPFPTVITKENLTTSVMNVEKEVVIILYKENPFVYTRDSDIDNLCCNANEFELRLLLEMHHFVPKVKRLKKLPKLSELCKWDGRVFVRHGTNVFPNWWCIERGTKVYKVSDLSSIQWNNVCHAVYVRKNEIELEKYRREYLRYMGGQTHVLCSIHNMPLIVMGEKKKDVNVICISCTGKQYYCCPTITCTSGVCMSCFRKFQCDKEVSICRGSILDPLYSHMSTEAGQERPVSPPIDIDNLSAASIETLSPFDTDDLPTGDYALIDDIEQDSESEDNGLPLIPTTNEASSPMEYTGNFGFMGASVLLNKCGTMLVRRQTQLQASKRERNILERVVSTKDVGTVPLIYLEGMLFPSIFSELPHAENGGILGSIPTPLFCQHETRKQLNFANVADHMKVRLKSVGNPVSTDPRYLSFAFDCLANGALEGQDTRIVLSRGFEESMGPAGLRLRNKDDDFYTDTIDNRQNVHNLSAAEKESPFGLFLTFTCNQREHFGVKAVKRYIDSPESVHNYTKHHQQTFNTDQGLLTRDYHEISKSFQESGRNLIVRNWMEVRLLLIDYLLKSPEKPIGNVLRIFVRDEYQNDVGNLSHLHMLVALEETYDTEKGKGYIQNLVRSCVDEIVGVDEVHGYIAEGIITDWDDYETLKEHARSFLPHTCSPRCMRRTGTGPNDLKCRVPDTRLLSKDVSSFYEMNLDLEHSEDTLLIMERIGLCEKRSETAGKFIPLHPFLEAKRILPPARFGEGNISPVVGRLFAATRSTMNIQICTTYGTSRYIVKYLIKMDENNYVVFSVDESGKNCKAERVHLNNTKITSSAINEKKVLKGNRIRNKPKGRQIAATEQMQLIFGFPQVFTNMEFVKIPTLPLAERAGFERQVPLERFESNDMSRENDDHDAFSFLVPCVSTRSGFKDVCRKHTQSQIIMLKDQMSSGVTLDRVFVFGIRPPELLCIDKLDIYYKCFYRSKTPVIRNKDDFLIGGILFHKRLDCSSWIDGLGYSIRLRSGGGVILRHFLMNSLCKDNWVKVKELLLEICEYLSDVGVTEGDTNDTVLRKNQFRRWQHLQAKFVIKSKQLPIPVFSNVKPHNAPRFIIHVLLSMGRFETECDLWGEPSFPLAFVKAGLVSPEALDPLNCDDLKNAIDHILYMWITEQLRFYPIGSKKVDEYIVAAEQILVSAIKDDCIPISEVPPYLYTSLLQEVDKEITAYLMESKLHMVTATLSGLEKVFEGMDVDMPSSESLLKATKSCNVNWEGNFPMTSRQSRESYEEQCCIQQQSIKLIHQYIESGSTACKNFIIAGPPGAGKTHCMAHAIVYALSKGLSCITTAVLADRAFVLGGKHIHKLFKLKVRNSGSAQRLAELAVINLQKQPRFVAHLRRLDILFIDEMGQLSAELLAVLDIILRRIRDSNLFMAGLLVIGTIDQHQLRPIRGLPFLMSPYILACFTMGLLTHYVRCSECSMLQELNSIARFYTTSQDLWEAKLVRFETLLRQNCTFVTDWNDPLITDEVISIFPRKRQTAKATARFLDKKTAALNKSNQPYLICFAKNEMVSRESHGDWHAANESVDHYLDSKCKEPAQLHLYKGGLYEFTFNKPGAFNATQLGILMELPTMQCISSFSDFDIYVAPAGINAIGNLQTLSAEDLENAGWQKKKISVAPDYPRSMPDKGLKVRRKQYGLRVHVSSTIHSALGSSLGKIATELKSDGLLWERAMVVVLISRVSRASDLIFVGDQDENIRALLHGLRVKDQYAEYMNHIVSVLVGSRLLGVTIPVNLGLHPFRPKDIQLPPKNCGIVYMLVSARDSGAMYIGQTFNIQRRLKEHNSGIGSRESCDPKKRPWALFAYITGFGLQRALMRKVELSWQNRVQREKPRDPIMGMQFGSQILSMMYSDYENLVLVTSRI